MSALEASNDAFDVGLGLQLTSDGLAQPNIVGVRLVVPKILGARVFGEGVSDREITVRDCRPTDRTPMSFVCGGLVYEQLLGVLGRVLTATDGTLPHTRSLGVRI